MTSKISTLTVLSLMLTIIIDVMGFSIVFPIFPALFMSSHSPLLNVMDTSFQRELFYSLSLLCFGVGFFFGIPYLGDLSDKAGRKKILLICLGGVFFSYCLSALAIVMHSFTLFVLSRLIDGFFGGSFPIAQAAIADMSTPQNKAQNLSWVTLSACLGFAMGPLVSGLSEGLTLTLPFLIAALLTLFNITNILMFLKETRPQKTDYRVSLFSVFKSCRFIFWDTRTRLIAFIFFCFSFSWSYYSTAAPFILSASFDYSQKQIGYFFSVLGLSCFLMNWLLQPTLFKHFKLTYLFVFGCTGLTLAFLLTLIFGRIWGHWLVATAGFMGENLGFGCLMALVSNAVGEDEQGKTMGGMASAFGLASLVVTASIGTLIHCYLNLPIVIAVVFLVVAITLMYAYRHDLHRNT